MAAIEIFTGPACSGKTAELLRVYRQAVVAGQQAGKPGRTLWITPTYLVGEQVRRQLISHSPVILAPQVLTFDGFAERILQFSSQTVRSLRPIMQRVLLRQIIDDQVQSGSLQYFAGIARTSGFLDVVSGLIAELKREEAWPEHFQDACSRRGARRADMELAAVYAVYQARLTQHQRYDAEGRFWSARDQLVHGNWGPFPELDLVVVDAFSDFTHTQYEILDHLAERSQRMLISLPCEAGDVRTELFAKPRVSLQRLRKVTSARITPMTISPDQDHPCGSFAIRHIAANLFSNPREIQPSTLTDGIEILAVTGTLGEVRAIAERVKRLLVEGVAASDVVVAFRPLTEYAPLVREVFSAASIPFQCSSPESLDQQPVIKAILSVLQLELEDWPFDRLYALLNSGWFRPRWSDWSAEKTPRSAATVIRRAKIPSGRTAMLGAFERLLAAAETAPRDDQFQASLISTSIASRCLNRLSDILSPLRQAHDAREWAEILRHIGGELGIAPQSADIDGQEAVDAWKSFEDLLFVSAETEELLGQSRRLDLSDMSAELFNLLQHQSLPAPGRQPGTVEVLEASQVRGLDVRHLFLGGLTESSFPQRGGESFLYSEADRHELNNLGLNLGHRIAQTQAEMLLFYGIVTRARETLTLSYPAVNLSGQPLSPSSYLNAVCELFDAGTLKRTRIERLDPVPTVDDMLSLADLRVVATSQALEKRPALFQTLMAQPGGDQTARSIAAAIDMAVQRFQTRGFTAYEGSLEQPANLKFLRERYSAEKEFSATQLESYAQCPFRFWASDVLKIQEAEAPDEFIDHGLRGDTVHEVLRELHSAIEPTPDAVPIEKAVELFRELLKKRLAGRIAETDLLVALLHIEERLLEEWGDEYAQQWAEYHAKIQEQSNGGLTPRHFEVSFGTPHSPAANEEVRPSLTLGHGGNETRIRGRIDRIDVGQVGGQTVFNIIDYKTGRKPETSAAYVKSGRTLQLVLYALATQRLDLAGDGALPLQAGYWCLKHSGWSPISKPPKFGPDGLEPNPDWLALVDVLDELVPRLAAGIRAGRFPVFNTDRDCMAYCAYRTTCRVSQIRPLQEALDKTWEP